MPKVKGKGTVAKAKSSPYPGSAVEAKAIAKSTKNASAASCTMNPLGKQKNYRQGSMKMFAWGEKEMIEWKDDVDINALVLDYTTSTQVDIHGLRENKRTIATMEDQAAMLSRNGKYEEAEEMQEHARQLKARIIPETERYYEVLEVAKKAAFVKQYCYEQKQYKAMGEMDKLLKAAQYVAMLDPNNKPLPPPQLQAAPTAGQMQTSTIDLVTNTDEEEEEEKEEDGAPETRESVENGNRNNDVTMIAVDGVERPLNDVFDAPQIHKQGKASKKKRIGATVGKVLDESRQGSRAKKDKKNPDIVTREMFEARLDEPVNRQGVYLENKREEGYEFDGEKCWCNSCNGIEVAYATLNQHSVGVKHRKNKVARIQREARVNSLLGRVDQHAKDAMLTGQSKTADVKAYHVEAIEEMCASNSSASTFQKLASFVDRNTGKGKVIGNVQDIVERWGPFLYNDLIKRNQEMVSIESCFREVSTTSDASPLIANTEAVRMTAVRKDTGEIISPLVHFELYGESLNGVKHANHLLRAIKDRDNGAGRDPKDWIVATQDGCAVNSAAIDHINSKTDYSVSKDTCCSHTLCLSGKAFVTPNWDKLRSKMNIVFRYKGKLRNRFGDTYHEAPIKSGGNRWWTDWEQGKQMSEFGIQDIIKNVIEWGVKNNASEQSCKTLLDLFSVDEEGGKERLALAIIENAAVCDVGYLYVIFTYIFEGDDPLILSAYRGFIKLDAAAGVNSDGQHDFDVPSVEKIADEAISLLKDARAPIAAAADTAAAVLADAENDLETKKEALKDLVGNRSRVGQGDRRSNREVTRTTFTNGGQVAANTRELKKKAEDAVKEQKKVVAEAKSEHDDKAEALSKWDDKYSHLLTLTEVIEYGKKCTRPGHEKYIEQFINPNGRCTNLRRCANVLRLLDPFELNRLDVTSLELLADGLCHFKSDDGTRWFSDEFIAGVKTEIPKAKEHAAKPFDWDKLPESDLFQNRSENRNLKKQLKKAAARARGEVETIAVDDEGNDVSDLIAEQSEVLGNRSTPPKAASWKDDLGEYARRIYLWWLPRWLHTKEFHYFGVVIRKAVLKKLSSAIVERDFSKYLAVTHAVGTTKIQKPMLHNRVYCMCNKKEYEKMKAKAANVDGV